MKNNDGKTAWLKSAGNTKRGVYLDVGGGAMFSILGLAAMCSATVLGVIGIREKTRRDLRIREFNRQCEVEDRVAHMK